MINLILRSDKMEKFSMPEQVSATLEIDETTRRVLVLNGLINYLVCWKVDLMKRRLKLFGKNVIATKMADWRIRQNL